MNINNRSNVYQNIPQDIYIFQNIHQEALFNKIIHHVRCSVCQNQTLADSEALLALDLKKMIYEQVQSKYSEKQIIEFITGRYGDFVLYETPLNLNTALLWFGPFMLLLFGIVAFTKYIKWN